MRVFHPTLGMRHHAQNATVLGQHARDIGGGAVGVLLIAESDAILPLQPGEKLGIGGVIFIVMRDRDRRQITRIPAGGEIAIRGRNLEVQRLAGEF